MVEDDDGLRPLVLSMLERAGFGAVGAATGEEALARDNASLAAAVVDVRLPGISGYEVCHELKSAHPEVLVLFVSGERAESFDRVAGLLLGGDDYLVKPFAPDELVARLRALLRRTGPAGARGLTERELEVLGHLADGLDKAAIAKRLVISPKTVGTHLEHIFKKLGVRTLAQAMAVAFRERIVT